MKKSSKILIYISIILFAAWIVKHFLQHADAPSHDVNAIVATLTSQSQLDDCCQLLIVLSDTLTSSNARLYAMQRCDSTWEIFAEKNAKIGRNGMVRASDKREGDGKTPIGLYALPNAFGTRNDIQIKIPFTAITPQHVWVSESNDTNYNRMIVDSLNEYANKDVERLYEYPVEYQYAVVIDYNGDRVPERGSAIFLHCLKEGKNHTAGCVALPKEELIPILQWLDPQCNPHIFINYVGKK